MRIVQAVFGVFHHFELAHQLYDRGHLTRIHTTWPWARVKREGLPRSLVRCFPPVHLTQYMANRYNLLSPAFNDRFNQWNSETFDAYLRQNVEPCEALIALSGAGETAGQQVQARGGRFLCDRGSTHQRFQDDVLSSEAARWGLTHPAPAAHILRREEAIYALADAITVPSTVARRSFVASGVAADKVHVIPYGVRLDRFRPEDEPPTDRFEVLFAGQVSLRKGIPYLLQAFARLRHPNKQLTVVGSMLDDVKAILPRLPVDHVVFTGTMPQHELAARMSRSHVMVLPSVEEGLALVQGQAMACGCPVIATRATGAEDLFTDGVEGFIVEDRDVDALSLRLEELAQNPERRLQMRAAGLERVKTLGGWDRYGDLWIDLLTTLTGATGQPT